MKKYYSFLKGLLMFLAFGSASTLHAQAICTTNLANGGENMVTFNVQNTNTYAIHINSVSTSMLGGLSGTYTFNLLYNVAAVSSNGATWIQGTVGVGQNGWVLAGSANTTMLTSTTPQTCINGLSLLVPAGATFGFALSCNGNLGCEVIANPVVNMWSNAGVNLITGLNVGWGGQPMPATPNAYSAGWQGCINFSSGTSSVNTANSLNDLAMYPNPCTGQFNVNFTSASLLKQVSVMITDITGKLIIQKAFEDINGNFRQEFDLSTQPKGVYLVGITADGQKTVDKITVR